MQKKDLIFQDLGIWKLEHTLNFTNAIIDHHLSFKH
jgi:hypothetical protein